MNKKGVLIIFSGPSGSGKGSVMHDILCGNEPQGKIKMSVSATTRPPREGEIDGEHYYFLKKEQFTDLISKDGILEYAEYCGNYYGTPRKQVEEWLCEGYDVILEIEVAGARQVMKKYPDALSIFLIPPSISELEKRLAGRNTEHPDVIKKRVSAAREEIKCAGEYEYIVINDVLEDTVASIWDILRAERYKSRNNLDLLNKVLEI